MTTDSPWLTVVTVVKDDQVGLRRSVSSLAGVEYLVVDSSVDSNSAASVLAESGIPNSKVEWCEPRGIYSAMNLGLELARGKYIYFLNAGDVFFDSEVLADLNAIVSLNSPVLVVGLVQIQEVVGSLL